MKRVAVNLVRETLKLDRIVGVENLQTLIEEDVVVPDSKPDISRILSVEGKVIILDKEIMQNKILVDGVVNFEILYALAGSEQPLHSMKASANFNQSIEMNDIDALMTPEVECKLEHIDYSIMNERKVSMQAVLNLTGRVFKTDKVDVLKGAEGIEDMQALKDKIKYDNLVGSNSAQTVLRETFEMAEDTPEIFQVLQTKGFVVVNETKLTDGKVIIGGNIKLSILYATEEPRNPVYEVNHELPFTHFVEVPKALEDMDCKTDLMIGDIFTEVKKNLEEQNKVYDMEVVLKAHVEVFDKEEKEVLLDAYSPSRNLNLQKSRLKFTRKVGKDSAQTVIKETLDLPDGHPSIFKVFTVNAKPTVTDYRIVEEKNIVEGFIKVTVLYVANTEEMQVYSFNEEIPFRHFVEMPGIKDHMDSNIKVNIEEINFSSINSKQVECKLNLGLYAEISEGCEKEVIVNLEDLGEENKEDNRASITIYFVQKGDTLWEIAKRYNTTVREILEANDIENPDEIMPGDRIIIQKTYKYKL
jgi:hypothetical protein